MKSSQLRKEARANLAGRWGKGALITLCYMAIVYGISIVSEFIPLIGSLAVLVINIPITYGIIASFIKFKRNEEVSYVGFLTDGFAVFGKTWAVTGRILQKMLVPIILLVVSIILMSAGIVGTAITGIASDVSLSSVGALSVIFTIVASILYIISYIWLIVKGFFYILANFILFDNPEMPAKDIVQKSEDLMRGNRGKYFYLSLSFIGWIILSVFTLGIGILWLTPYMMIAEVFFYEKLAGKSDVLPDKEENVEPIQEQ